MGDGEKASLKLKVDPEVRLQFHGATISSDAGLLATRESVVAPGWVSKTAWSAILWERGDEAALGTGVEVGLVSTAPGSSSLYLTSS